MDRPGWLSGSMGRLSGCPLIVLVLVCPDWLGARPHVGQVRSNGQGLEHTGDLLSIVRVLMMMVTAAVTASQAFRPSSNRWSHDYWWPGLVYVRHPVGLSIPYLDLSIVISVMVNVRTVVSSYLPKFFFSLGSFSWLCTLLSPGWLSFYLPEWVIWW